MSAPVSHCVTVVSFFVHGGLTLQVGHRDSERAAVLQMSEGIALNPCHVGSAVRMFFSSQDIHFRILPTFPPGGGYVGLGTPLDAPLPLIQAQPSGPTTSPKAVSHPSFPSTPCLFFFPSHEGSCDQSDLATCVTQCRHSPTT